jgi:hypothetical protein
MYKDRHIHRHLSRLRWRWRILEYNEQNRTYQIIDTMPEGNIIYAKIGPDDDTLDENNDDK